jgi:adenylate kinase
MKKRVILVTGTPCVGKTSVSHLLASKLDALYVNLTDLAVKENLTLGKDEERNSIIVDESRVKQRLEEIIRSSEKHDIIIDGHYAASVVSKRLVSHIFVLRRDPVELRMLMEQSGFSGRKLWENLASEILDACLYDAVNAYGEQKICELDASRKNVEEIVAEIFEVLGGSRKCRVGIVDWLGKLEREGLLEKYLRI